MAMNTRSLEVTFRKKHTTDNKPMEHFMEKAMSASANGGIQFFDEAEFEESLSRIMEQHDVKKRFGQIICLARQCEEHSFEYRAVSLYRHVLWNAVTGISGVSIPNSKTRARIRSLLTARSRIGANSRTSSTAKCVIFL